MPMASSPSSGTSKKPQGVMPLVVPEDRLPGTVVVTRKPASPAIWGNDYHRYHPHDAPSPILVDTLDDNKKLTKNRDSRPSRLPATVPDSSAILIDQKPHSAIPAYSTHRPNNNFGQDVRELVNTASLPSPSPASHFPVSTLQLLGTPVSSIFNQDGLTTAHSHLGTSNQIFQTGEELALHYGIPTLLPPPPKIQKTEQPQSQSPIIDFDTLRANYLNMISQKPSDMSVDTTAPTPAELLPSSHMGQPEPTLEELVNALTCRSALVTWSIKTESELNTAPQWEFLTSPAALGTPAQDFESSPDETPLNDFLNTPLLDMDDEYLQSPAFNSDLTLFATDEPYYTTTPASLKTKPADLPPELPDCLISMPPIPDAEAIDPTSIYPSPPLAAPPMSFPLATTPDVSSSSSSTRPTMTVAPSARRTRAATGTRKNLTADKLIPFDAPTQPRRYITPSVTSRKEVPAVFQRKRQRSEMEDELDELEPLSPNATEREQIDYKRRQNTLAARKSRKRKLMYQQELEEAKADLLEEVTTWKTRCDVLSKMLESHGIPPPSFTD